MSLSPQVRRLRLAREAEGYLLLEMPEQALAVLERVADPDQASFEESLVRGRVYRLLNRHAEALSAYRPAFADKPDHVPLLLEMAWCHKRIGEVPRSVELLEQAYKLEPERALILYNLSCYWAILGNKTQCLSWLGRAIRLDPSFRELVPREPDFDPLRNDPDFQFITGLRASRRPGP